MSKSGPAAAAVTGLLAAGVLVVGGGAAAHASNSGAHATAGKHSASATPVSRERAKRIALRAVPHTRVTEVELEREHGLRIWAVELHRGRAEWQVDAGAVTGRVLDIEREH